MKLPNVENAFIDISKLTDYCLNEEHPVGKHKAKVFKSALGMTMFHADVLADLLWTAVQNADCEIGLSDEYGNRYLTDVLIEWENKAAVVRIAWIIRTQENFPRLTSCYIKK